MQCDVTRFIIRISNKASQGMELPEFCQRTFCGFKYYLQCNQENAVQIFLS